MRLRKFISLLKDIELVSARAQHCLPYLHALLNLFPHLHPPRVHFTVLTFLHLPHQCSLVP